MLGLAQLVEDLSVACRENGDPVELGRRPE
jgi:hypothetical protein